MRRTVSLLTTGVLLGGVLAAGTGPSTPATAAVPVAVDANSYQAMGRVFPDPHGCTQGAPGTSPWAKGNVCAAQFLQWDDVLSGVGLLEETFPDYVQLINLRTQFGDLPQLAQEELQSAGLPRENLDRLKRDLYVVKVTNRESPVPERERRHFAYALSIHGIERAGIEGGIRAVEDLVSWAACEQQPGETDSPVCTNEGPFPRQILEPFDAEADVLEPDAGPTAGEVVDNGVIYFVLANPDGWHRGELSEGGVFFQRYNGNGMDLNRDWPTVGFTDAQYTPFSEPETRGYGRFLEFVRDTTAEGAFAGAIDLHGMLTAPAFSFTLLGAGQRDFRKNAVTVDTSITTFRDAEQRLTWSSLIGPEGDCGSTTRMCSDQWGTVWDTINYQVTGSFGDWMDSDLGLDAVGIDNEMALSHLAPNNAFVPEVEQLHIDGNKGLIYAQIASLLFEDQVVYEPGGRIAYVHDDERIVDEGGGTAENPDANLPTQDDVEGIEVAGEGFAFEVEGPADGVFNGGLTVEATFANARGISGHSLGALVLERKGGTEHVGDDPDEWVEVARYFNQSAIYAQAGARIDLNAPLPGEYRIRPNPTRTGPTEYHVSFSRDSAFPQPEQAPYDVSRMDFFAGMNEYVAAGADPLAPVTPDAVLADPTVLDRFDTLVVANDLMPGFVPEQAAPEPAGDPQAPVEMTFGPEAAPAPSLGASSSAQEFEVDPASDNDRMTVTGRWALASDYDIQVEFFDPETEEWQDRGCQCAFVNNGEQVTVTAPEPGRWRVVLANFAAAPQQVDVRVVFEADPAVPAAPESRFTAEELGRYTDALAAFAAGGGNLVLTDAAMAALPSLVPALPATLEPAEEGEEPVPTVGGGVFYAGWMDFNDGEAPTYPDRETGEGGHDLASAVNKEGTAEGSASIGGEDFDNRHQTYEPTPLGFYVSSSGSSNASCTNDRCDAPNWVVDQQAWEAAGGTTAARTLVRESPTPGSASRTGVSLGELPLGEGMIRIAGGLLPDPSEENFHPFGLRSYALTYTGYQVFENLTQWDNPNRVDDGGTTEPEHPGRGKGRGDNPGKGTGPGGNAGQGNGGDSGDGATQLSATAAGATVTPARDAGAAGLAALAVAGLLGLAVVGRRRLLRQRLVRED